MHFPLSSWRSLLLEAIFLVWNSPNTVWRPPAGLRPDPLGVRRQWRSKALRGPGSTVTWGPPFPSHPLPLPPLPLPFPPLPKPSPSPAAKRPPNPARGLGERCKLPHGVFPKSNLVHFSIKIRHLVATIILIIFIRVLPKIFLWPHYSGAPGARGPRFIEPPEPPVPTPLRRDNI